MRISSQLIIATKRRFLEAAISLFLKDPHHMTAREIARKAKGSTAPIYTYYQSVSQLRNLAVKHIIARLTQHLKTYNCDSASKLVMWYFEKCPSLAVEVLDNNKEIIEYLASTINCNINDSPSITHHYIILIATTQYLYHTLEHENLTVNSWINLLDGLYINIKH